MRLRRKPICLGFYGEISEQIEAFDLCIKGKTVAHRFHRTGQCLVNEGALEVMNAIGDLVLTHPYKGKDIRHAEILFKAVRKPHLDRRAVDAHVLYAVRLCRQQKLARHLLDREGGTQGQISLVAVGEQVVADLLDRLRSREGGFSSCLGKAVKCEGIGRYLCQYKIVFKTDRLAACRRLFRVGRCVTRYQNIGLCSGKIKRCHKTAVLLLAVYGGGLQRTDVQRVKTARPRYRYRNALVFPAGNVRKIDELTHIGIPYHRADAGLFRACNGILYGCLVKQLCHRHIGFKEGKLLFAHTRVDAARLLPRKANFATCRQIFPQKCNCAFVEAVHIGDQNAVVNAFSDTKRRALNPCVTGENRLLTKVEGIPALGKHLHKREPFFVQCTNRALRIVLAVHRKGRVNGVDHQRAHRLLPAGKQATEVGEIAIKLYHRIVPRQMV